MLNILKWQNHNVNRNSGRPILWLFTPRNKRTFCIPPPGLINFLQSESENPFPHLLKY